MVLVGSVGGYSALVGADNYYLPYEVKVGAYNNLGDGPNSTVVVIYSAMGSKESNLMTALKSLKDLLWKFLPMHINNTALCIQYLQLFKRMLKG